MEYYRIVDKRLSMCDKLPAWYSNLYLGYVHFTLQLNYNRRVRSSIWRVKYEESPPPPPPLLVTYQIGDVSHASFLPLKLSPIFFSSYSRGMSYFVLTNDSKKEIWAFQNLLFFHTFFFFFCKPVNLSPIFHSICTIALKKKKKLFVAQRLGFVTTIPSATPDLYASSLQFYCESVFENVKLEKVWKEKFLDLKVIIITNRKALNLQESS